MNPVAATAAAPATPLLAEGSAEVSPFLENQSQDTRLAQALARLQASRAQLRAAMLPPPPQQDSASPGFELPRRWRAMWRAWTRNGPLQLVAGTAMGAARSWWRKQPWQASTEWAGRAVWAETTPLIRRHPFLAVVLGVGAGAALVAARPWRWPAVNRSVRPLGGHVVSWVVAQLSQVPVQMALAALLAKFVAERMHGQADTPTAEPTPPAAPSPEPVQNPAHHDDPVAGRSDAAAGNAIVH